MSLHLPVARLHRLFGVCIAIALMTTGAAGALIFTGHYRAAIVCAVVAAAAWSGTVLLTALHRRP